jgi:hypothetical protein
LSLILLQSHHIRGWPRNVILYGVLTRAIMRELQRVGTAGERSARELQQQHAKDTAQWTVHVDEWLWTRSLSYALCHSPSCLKIPSECPTTETDWVDAFSEEMTTFCLPLCRLLCQLFCRFLSRVALLVTFSQEMTPLTLSATLSARRSLISRLHY